MKKKRPEFATDVKRKLMEKTGNKCERCGIDFDTSFKGIFHHIIPVVFGGDNNIDNCSLLCEDCHRIAPNIKSKEELALYDHYFLRFASFKEAAQYYRAENKFDLHIKAALDIAKKSKKKF